MRICAIISWIFTIFIVNICDMFSKYNCNRAWIFVIKHNSITSWIFFRLMSNPGFHSPWQMLVNKHYVCQLHIQVINAKVRAHSSCHIFSSANRDLYFHCHKVISAFYLWYMITIFWQIICYRIHVYPIICLVFLRPLTMICNYQHPHRN